MTETATCACRALVPHSRVYDLHALPGAWEQPALLVQVDTWELRCTRCNRRWLGEELGGGGIYGNTQWWDAPPTGPAVLDAPAPSAHPPGVDAAPPSAPPRPKPEV